MASPFTHPSIVRSRPGRTGVVGQLAERIERIEATCRPKDRPADMPAIPLFQLLLADSLPAGVIVEMLPASAGAGAWTMALLTAARICAGQKTLVIVDPKRNFHPPAAARLGLDLQRVIVVGTQNVRDQWAALDQALRCSAVGAAVSWCDPLPATNYRRLQLAAENGGSLGLILRPGNAVRASSFAFLRLMVTPVHSKDAVRRVQVDVLRCRRRAAATSMMLEIDDATGDVRLPPPMAAAMPLAKAE